MLLKENFVMQGGVKNYLGKTEEVKAPKFWQSSEDSPPTELAYITEAEKGLLLDANLHGSLKNNKPNIGASGLLSFDGYGSRDSSQNRAGGDVSRDMDRGRDDSGSRSSGGGSTSAFQGQQSNKYNTAMSEAREKKAEAKNIVDLVNSGANLNDAISGKTSWERILSSNSPFKSLDVLGEFLSPIANAHNKKRRSSWLEGTDKFGMPRSRDFYIAHGKAFDPTATLVEGSPEHDFLKDSGYFKQFENKDTGGENNPEQLFDFKEDFTYQNIVTNNNPSSMVNQYFSNLGNSNLGISSDYTNTYNQAKANLAKSLNMTPNTQQYGYTANPYSQYPSTMTSANPFFDELTEQGLI